MLLRDYTQYFKTNPLCKDGNALYKSAPFILIIAGRELRVSIFKLLFKLTKKTGVYASVQCERNAAPVTKMSRNY